MFVCAKELLAESERAVSVPRCHMGADSDNLVLLTPRQNCWRAPGTMSTAMDLSMARSNPISLVPVGLNDFENLHQDRFGENNPNDDEEESNEDES
jgi:hypothetical protein